MATLSVGQAEKLLSPTLWHHQDRLATVQNLIQDPFLQLKFTTALSFSSVAVELEVLIVLLVSYQCLKHLTRLELADQ